MPKLQAYSASTAEVDDVECAVEDILAQIPLNELKKHALGIVACHYEFAFSGVLEGISAALPFAVVGTISSAQGIAKDVGTFELVLTVLTSDDVTFASVLSEPLVGDTDDVVDATYREACSSLSQSPDLVLLHGPFMLQNNGDNYLTKLNSISDNAPVFGTLAVDDTEDFRNCFSIFAGKTYNDRLVLTLIKGVEPRFYSANIAANKNVGKPVLITESEGALLSKVNDRSIAEYLEELGLATLAENGYAMASMPFILDYGDGTAPISRIFIQLTPDGKAILNGSVPVGAQLVIGSFDKEDALETTRVVVDGVLAQIAEDDSKPSVLLLYSCIARSIALGSEYLLELEQVQQQIGGALPFMMAYSGGEYCPTELAQSGAVNRFHNNALIVCAL